MAELNDLVILDADDWAGLFKNGKLVDQGHNIPLRDLSDHCPILSLSLEAASTNVCQYLLWHGSFPENVTLDEARNLYLPPEELENLIG